MIICTIRNTVPLKMRCFYFLAFQTENLEKGRASIFAEQHHIRGEDQGPVVKSMIKQYPAV